MAGLPDLPVSVAGEKSSVKISKTSSRQNPFLNTKRTRRMAKTKRIGILTSGGDSPGLNAAIRGVGKTALGFYGMEIIGFRDGFRGLVTDRRLKLDRNV